VKFIAQEDVLVLTELQSLFTCNAKWSREQKQCWAHSGTEM